MIRLGLRLAVAGGREAVTRLLIVAAAVTLGVGLLLATLAGMNAEKAQNGRYAWLQTGNESARSQTSTGTADPLWWSARYDYYDGQMIGRVDVSAVGPHAPVPPGIPRLPGPGELYASPAMATLLATTPAGQLADRYPGHVVGTIGRAGLPDPSMLIVIVGHPAQEMSPWPGATRVTSIASTVEGSRSDALMLVLAVVAGALLFPVLIFIGTATRLSAARREQRFAAMRLVGATPRQVSLLAMVESIAAALVGTAAGFGLFLALRGPLASIPFTGTRFYLDDVSLNLPDVILVVLGIPVGAAIAAGLALRRVRISPLGVTRRVSPRPPRPYRLIPLVVGVTELAYFVGRRPASTNGQVAAYLGGLLLMMIGLVLAGPWLTMVGARLLAGRSRRAATLIAARRLADNPAAGFRAISGVVLALFVTSVASGVITTVVAHRGVHNSAAGSDSVMSANFWPDTDRATATTVVSDQVLRDLRALPGVRAAVVVRYDEAAAKRPDGLPGVVACADLTRLPDLVRCPAGAAVASVWPNLLAPSGLSGGDPRDTGRALPAAPFSVEQIQRLDVFSVVAATDGATATLERVRTLLEIAYPGLRFAPSTDADQGLNRVQTLAGWQRLADVVILATLPIAGCSLAVSVAGGLSERKRPFSLLRLSGVPLRMLRTVVGLESAAPLLVASVIAVGAGLLAAHLFLRSQMQYTLDSPGAAFYLIVVAGVAVSLGIIGATLPILKRITGPETARNE